MSNNELSYQGFYPPTTAEIRKLPREELEELSIRMIELIGRLDLDKKISPGAKSQVLKTLISDMRELSIENTRLKCEIENMINENKLSVEIIKEYEKAILSNKESTRISQGRNQKISSRVRSHQQKGTRKKFIKLYSMISGGKR